jgi:multicomponent K+:H+ antiporter subunit E
VKRRALLPSPAWTAVLMLCWLWLNNTLAPGHIVLGLLLGLAIPVVVAAVAPASDDRRRLPPLTKLLPFLALVSWDILVANIRVALLILGPRARIRSGFIEVPLALERELSAHVLASVITLTPGTVSVRFSPDRRRLLVHYLSSDDPAGLVREIRERYEQPIREIFEA